MSDTFSTDSTPTIRARFAPSPTGFLHLGGARTALFNWAFIQHFQMQTPNKLTAEFLLRIENTDVERSTQPAIDAILQAMDWLGLKYRHPPCYQTDRLVRYREMAKSMLDKGLAYYCYASKAELDQLREAQKARGEKPRYDRRWRNNPKPPPRDIVPVIRFQNPDHGNVYWDDLIKGPISIDNAELDDFIILRADGMPTYNFANVIDDSDQKITHVIRGDDHVNNTPKQINLYRALNLPIPEFAHLSMIHGHDGEKLSKRHGAINVMEYRERGILPEALMNYLARLGFSHGNDEIFSSDQLAAWFNWRHVQSSPARFDLQKLLWINQHYLRQCDEAKRLELVEELAPGLIKQASCRIDPAKILALYGERSMTVLELVQAVRCCVNDDILPHHEPALQSILRSAKPLLESLHQALANCPNQHWQLEPLKIIFQQCLKDHGVKMGQLGIPLRIALLGEKQSPSIDKLLAAFHQPWALKRLTDALAFINQ